MPVASSSRRRRQPSDAIEVDETSQRTAPEAVEEEDELDRPRTRRKAQKGKEKGVPDGADDDDDEDPLAEVGDQPLDKTQGPRLAGAASDWEMMRRQTLGTYFGLVRDVATVFAEFSNDDKGEKVLTEMDIVVRELLDTETELHAHQTALTNLSQKVARQDPITDAVNIYEQEVKHRLDDYGHKTARQKYGKSEQYASFKQAIFEVQHPDTAMPPVTDFLAKEDGDDSDDDEDLVIGGVTQDYKCPLTLTILVDPLTSRLCGHSFSKSAIQEYLGHTKKECPASGCTKTISMNDLESNQELAKKAKDAARRERMREEDSDAEEVVE